MTGYYLPIGLMCCECAKPEVFVPFFCILHHTEPASPAFTGCLPYVHLSCALPCLISCLFVTKAHSNCANGQLCLLRFCQSRQIKHVRWHVEEKVLWFIMELFTNKSYFSWPDTCSLRLDHISRHYRRLLKYSGSWDVCVLVSVCLHIWMQLENWSRDFDYKSKSEGEKLSPDSPHFQ